VFLFRTYFSHKIGKLTEKSDIPALIALLSHKDKSVRKRAAEGLNALRWIPETDRHQALHAIAFEDWKRAAKYGGLAKVAVVSEPSNVNGRATPNPEQFASAFLQGLTSTDSADFIVKLKWTAVKVGDYASTNISADRLDCAVSIQNAHTKAALLSRGRNFMGTPPPTSTPLTSMSQVYEKSSRAGDFPVQEVRDYLATLVEVFLALDEPSRPADNATLVT
jgi:hypothetical protein